MKQKGSYDVKGSLWNHLDKVILWHRESTFIFKSVDVPQYFLVLLVPGLKRQSLIASIAASAFRQQKSSYLYVC